MDRSAISVEHFLVRPHDLWNNRWFLLTCGNFKRREFNAMTVSWGSMGTLWNIPFVQVVVRPSRYTFQFMERFTTFTLSVFPESKRQALELIGSRSGRDGDKIRESGLTPIPSLKIEAPGFAEAELIIECRKMYYGDMEPSHFLDSGILSHYPQKDYHRIYFGEILSIAGIRAYRS
jgi:flavin reductase (DIM6/NTAB) family NADH-FMN oxidoreductase RutF